ncbi:MAG: hypothetical protein IPK83_21610 [Planctomycetes bacterium]|nr:hypothetical protein [Planctomycetota bacterium]
MACAALLIVALTTAAPASFAEPPADKKADEPKDDDKNARENKDNDDRPPLGGPRSDRPRRRGPEGRQRGMDDDDQGDRPGSFGPREGRGQRPFRPDGEGPRESRRGPFAPRGDGDAPFPPIPPEVMKELEEIIRVEAPELYKRIMRWRENQPERFDRAMAKFQPSIREYLTLRSAEPALAKKVMREIGIEIRIRKLAFEYARFDADSASPERSRIEGELGKLVREQVDIRLERRAARLRFLEAKLEEEKAKLAAEQAAIEVHYKARLEEVKRGHFDDPESGRGFKGPRGPGGPPPGDRGATRGERRPRDRRADDDRDPPPDRREPPPDDEAEEMSRP